MHTQSLCKKDQLHSKNTLYVNFYTQHMHTSLFLLSSFFCNYTKMLENLLNFVINEIKQKLHKCLLPLLMKQTEAAFPL